MSKRSLRIEESDDDLTQCDSPPTSKKSCLTLQDRRKWEDNKENIQCSADSYSAQDMMNKDLQWSEQVNLSNDVVTQANIVMVHAGIQTDEQSNYESANEMFGKFVAHELSNIPIFKRRFVMCEIIKVLERNSD
ncbi:hypothetical protein evm_013453 [Chilo suppressalis]|nr:hypothetical protein evm_015207 [Chilo suppressalis]RVE41903.1 hypothetical protein evm_013453 [Chilo suppressalis]